MTLDWYIPSASVTVLLDDNLLLLHSKYSINSINSTNANARNSIVHAIAAITLSNKTKHATYKYTSDGDYLQRLL